MDGTRVKTLDTFDNKTGIQQVAVITFRLPTFRQVLIAGLEQSEYKLTNW